MEMKHVVLDGEHDARDLRSALGRFPNGVTVVTAHTQDRQDGRPHRELVRRAVAGATRSCCGA